MNSAASPTVRDAFTPDDAAVLCLICTGTATGSQLVATLTVRPEFTLAEVRRVLEKLARTGDGGDLMVQEAPVNVTDEQAAAILDAPLHPLDLTGPFSFVRCGGCRTYSARQEQHTTCAAAFPRFPRLGVPSAEAGAVWSLSPPAPLVVVPYFPPAVLAASPTSPDGPQARASPSGRGDGGAMPRAQAHVHAATAASLLTEAQLAQAQKRLAAAVLFVAQGDAHHTHLERAMSERLLLSQQLCGGPGPSSSSSTAAASSSGSALAGSARRAGLSAASTFGQRFSLSAWSSSVTRWNANLTDYLGRTTLQEAAAAGNEVAVRFLLSQSYVQVDAQTAAGHTALHLAVHGNHAGVVRLLLEEGNATVLLANAQGNTALHVALLEHRAGLVALLCQRLRTRSGGEVSLKTLAALKNRDGYSPIQLFEMSSPSVMELAEEGRLVPVKALVTHLLFASAHLRARDALLHGTIIHAAAGSGNAELLRFLCEDVAVFPEGSRDAQPSPVNLAAMASSSAATALSGASASTALLRWMLDGRFQTPLHIATRRGHLDCTRYLAGRYPLWLSVPDINGDTPLLLAIKCRQFHVAEFFLLQCAPGTIAANVCDHRGLTALHYVCGLGMAPAAEALLTQHGAKANANADRLALGSVCRPLNSSSRVWGPHQRNRLLVRAGATVELSSAKRAEAIRAGRRGTAVAKTSAPTPMLQPFAAGALSSSTSPTLATARHPTVHPSSVCGGGLRGSTPLLCAIAAGQVLNVGDVVRVLCRFGAIDNKEDAADLFFYLLVRGEERLANEIVRSSQDDGLVRAVSADNVLLLRFCEARVERGIRWCVESRCGAWDRPARVPLSGGITHPLVMSAAAGDVGAIRYFVSKGADVNVPVSAAVTTGSSGDGGSSRAAPAAAAATITTAQSHPLLTAILYRQEEVVRVLVQSGARLSAGDGSWCALQTAALMGLEPVVHGLLGQPALSKFDVAQALLAVLQHTWATTPMTTATDGATICTDRWQSRTTAARAATEQRIAVALAEHYDPTASEMHPTELLHLSAARGLFAVTRAVLRRCARLPATLRAELVRTTPAAPARVWKLIEPTMEPISDDLKHLTRLLPSTASGKGGLYRLRRPFERLVLPSWRRAVHMDTLVLGSGTALMSEGRLLHRVHVRDVFSYAAAANQVALLCQLQDVLPGMLPWPGPDMRGWTAMDYALQPRSGLAHKSNGGGPAPELVCLLLLAGVSPRSRHGRRLLPTRVSLLPRAVQSLVSWPSRQSGADRGSSTSSKWTRAGREGERLLAHVLCALLQRGPCDVNVAPCTTIGTGSAGHTHEKTRGGFVRHADLWTLQTVRALLMQYRTSVEAAEAIRSSGIAVLMADDEAVERQSAASSSRSPSTPAADETRPSSSAATPTAGKWLLPVVHAAVQHAHLDVLALLQEVLAYPFHLMTGYVAPAPSSSASAAGPPAVVPSPLLSAVASGNEELVAFFLRAGCCAYEPSPMTLDMASVIPLKHAESCTVTPLCYAAWLGRVDVLLQLVGGSLVASEGPNATAAVTAHCLRPDQCCDDGAQLGDALKALFHTSSLARCRQRQPGPLADALLAKAVRALAGVGHPYLSPLVLRTALAQHLPVCAQALIQSYGPATVEVDLIPEEINSLHYLVATPALVPLLRTLLVTTSSDGSASSTAGVPRRALGLEVVSWTPLAQKLWAVDFRRAALDPVDYALAHGCADGALLLVAAGWTGGSGRVAAVHTSSCRRRGAREGGLLLAHTAAVLQHFQHHRHLYSAGDVLGSHGGGGGGSGYSVLHSAVALGYDAVVTALVAHMCKLPRNAYAQDSQQPSCRSAMEVMCVGHQKEHPHWRHRGRPLTSDADEEEDEDNDKSMPPRSPQASTAVPPSVYALAALHAHGAHYLPLLEEVVRQEQPLRPRDVACFVFNPALRVTRVIDALCRQAINASVYGQVFSLLPDLTEDPSSLSTAAVGAQGFAQETPYAAFFARLWHDRRRALLFHGVGAYIGPNGAMGHEAGGDTVGCGGMWALTACTALTAAVAAGRLEWVQYVAFCDPAMRQHRAMLRRCETRAQRGCGNRAPLPSAPMRRHASSTRDRDGQKSQRKTKKAKRARSRDRAAGRCVARPHRCDTGTQWPLTLHLAGPTIGVDALVLCVLYMAQAFQARDAARRQQYTDIFSFLISLPGALTRANVNLVAMSLAAMREWDLLALLLTRADQFRRLLTSRIPAATTTTTAGDEDGATNDAASSSHTRYFTALLDEEVPVVLRGLLGPARHVIHLVARWAPKETMLAVARRAQRADVEACVDAEGCTALFHALHHASPTECGLACLVALRVPVHTVCCQRTARTPLMVAASEGRLHLVTTLLESAKVRAQINDADRRGYTPLMLAAAHGHVEVVELLLASDAAPSVQSHDGRTAVMLAAENGHDALAAPLVQHFSKTRDLVSAQTTVLHAAALGSATRTIDAVLKQLADPLAAVLQPDSDGHTALYLAHAFGCGAAVRAFLGVLFQPSAGRDPTVQTWAAQSLSVLHAEEDVRCRAQLEELNASDPWFSHVRGLYEIDDEASQLRQQPGPSWQRLGSGAVLSPDACDARLYLCDPRLTTYGWWRGVLEVNAVLALEAAAADTAAPSTTGIVSSSSSSSLWSSRLRPDEKVIAPQTPPWRGHVRGPRGDSLTCLVWCAQTNNAVGVRVLADYNVSDADGLALRWAAKYGHMDILKLLVQLRMSDASMRDAQDGLYAFEVAARHQHTACAMYLLAQTRLPWLSEWLPPLPAALEKADGASDDAGCAQLASDLYVHTTFHRLAPVCEGEVLVAFVEQLMTQTTTTTTTTTTTVAAVAAGSATALTCARLWAELQRPDEAGLTPFEYTVARGNAASVLRTAQLMQRLSDGARGVPMDAQGARAAGYRGAESVDAVSISSALLQYLPTLSPAVRTLLFDFFALQDVCHTVGFEASVPPPLSESEAKGEVRRVTSPRSRDRLRFGDVRLLGIAALRQQPLFRSVLSSVYTVDHERQVLRGQLYDFPFRIRYEPESFRQCTLAEQISLLQWLSSSLLLDAYEGISAEEVETIEVSVVKHRSHEFLEGVGTVNLSHSLYISSNQYLSLPDVKDAVWSAIQHSRSALCHEVRRAAHRASKVLQALPHPALRRGVVSVDWPLQTHEQDAVPWQALSGADASGTTFWTALEDSRTWSPAAQCLCAAMEDLAVYLRGDASAILCAVRQEGDIAAVVGRGDARRRRASAADPADMTTSTSTAAGTMALTADGASALDDDGIAASRVVFRYVDGDVATLAAAKAQHDRQVHPSSTCVVLFNESGVAPLKDALDATLLRALRADVSLVGIHYARSRFLKGLKAAMQTAVEQDAADGARASQSVSATTPAPAAAPPIAPAVLFKLELEGSRVDGIPLPMLETMLDATVEAAQLLLFTEPGGVTPAHAQGGVDDGCVVGGAPLSRYRAARLVRDALLLRLRQVLVLFTTRRDALVRFTDDKLMLCFGPTSFPSVSDIVDELKRATLEAEVAACQRVLPEVLTAMQEKLQARLPAARLIFDEASLTRAVCTSEEDNPSAVRVTNLELQASAYRLLVAQHSRLVLQPLIEGLTMGWDTAIGAVVRQELREVHVRMETAESGSCYLSPDGARLLYYCPLQCVQYGTLTQAFGGWQLLTSTQIASLYLMQLLVRHRGLAKLIDREKAVACWTSVLPLCVARVQAGATLRLWLRGRNLLNQLVHHGGETFTFVGRGVSPDSVHVLERAPTGTRASKKTLAATAGGDGRYVVRFTAPLRAGDERLHILLHGQPIAASPLRLCVESGPVELARTQLFVPYNTVLAKRPFKVVLVLYDAHGNRLSRTPKDLQVQLPHDHVDRDVSVVGWQHEGPSRVAVELVVQTDKPALSLALEVSVPEPVSTAEAARMAAGVDADGVYLSPVAAAASSAAQTRRLSHVCASVKNALSVVTRHRLDEIFALLSGQTLDSVPDRQRRRRLRQRARQQRQREAARRTAPPQPQPSQPPGAALPASTSAASPTRPRASQRASSPASFGSPTRPRTMKMSDREKLFFRKSIRQSEKRRLKHEAAGIEGGVAGRTFPPELVRECQ